MSGSLPAGFEIEDAPAVPAPVLVAAPPARAPRVRVEAPSAAPAAGLPDTGGDLVEFPTGGGKLPDGSVTTDPGVWGRWKQEYLTPTGNSQFIGSGPADAGPVVASPGPVTAGGPAAAPDATALPAGFELEDDAPPAAAPAAAPAGPAPRTGFLANAGAALAEGAGGILNTLSDPVGNLVTKPLSMALIAGHDALAPVFGYKPFPDEVRNTLYDENAPQVGTAAVNSLAKAAGIDMSSIQPATEGEALVRKGLGAALGGAALGGGGLLRTAAINPALGAVGAVGGHEAASLASERYAPFVEAAAGMAIPMAAEAGASLAGATARRAGAYAEPFVGRERPITDANGAPLLDADGQPLRMLESGEPIAATPNQLRMVGDRLREHVSDPDAAQQALANVPASAIAGDAPTAAQAYPDAKLLAAETRIAPTKVAQSAFRQRQDRQNDARVSELDRVGAGANPRAINDRVGADAAAQDAQMDAATQRVRDDQGVAVDQTRQAGEAVVDQSRRQGEAAVGQARDAGAQTIERTRQAGDAVVDRTRQEGEAAVGQARQAGEAAVDQTRREGEATVAGLQGAAQTRAREVAGRFEPGQERLLGEHIAEPVLTSHQREKAAGRRMYEGVDPEGTLNLNGSPIKDAGTEVRSTVRKLDDPLSAKEEAILDGIAGMNSVEPFAVIRGLRKRVGALVAAAARDPERATEHWRMSAVLRSIDDALDGAAAGKAEGGAGDAAAPKPAPRPAGDRAEGAPAEGGAAAIPNEIHRENGDRIPVRYRVVEASELVTSHHDNLSENDAYPQVMQPKDRGTKASADQINSIHQKLQPHRMGHSTSLNEGAPLVNTAGEVVNGNGRTLALRRVYRDGGEAAAAYREHLESLGHDTAGMREPVLVRELGDDVTPATQVQMAEEGGGSTGLKATAPEQAKVDAKHIDDDLMQKLRPGPLTGEANADFVRGFAQNVLDRNARGTFTTGTGELSQTGAKRISDALVHRAYGDDGVTAAHAEITDPEGKAFIGAMADAAGPMARLKAGIEAKAVEPSMDLAPAIAEAARVLGEARRSRLSLSEYLAQQDMLSRISPEAEAQLRIAYGEDLAGKMNQEAFATYLSEYAARAEKVGMTQSMFGDNVSSAEIIGELSSRYGKDARTAARTQPAPAKGDGGGFGRGGDEARRPVDGADRPEAPSGSSRGDKPANVLEAPLDENLDPAAVQRLREANAHHGRTKDTFQNAPGVGQITGRGSRKGEFLTPREDLPAIIVRTGDKGAEVAKAYLNAGGSTEHLTDAAAFSLRKAAMVDGVIDPAKFLTWMSQRQSFLSQIPDAARRFGSAAELAGVAQVGEKMAGARLKEAEKAAGQGVKDAERTAGQQLTGALRTAGGWLKAAEKAAGIGVREAERTAGAAVKDAERVTGQALKDAMKAAAETISEAEGRQADVVRARQDSAVGRFLGDRDPVTEVGNILADKSRGEPRMRELFEAIKGDRFAVEGLQRAVSQYMLREMQGAQKGAESESGLLHAARVQKFLRQAEPMLRVALEPHQVTALQNVAGSLERSGRSAKVGSGSDTSQKVGSTIVEKLAAHLPTGSAAGVGYALGHLLAGPAGGAVGGAAGAIGGALAKAARDAGLRTVADLEALALLHPQLFALALSRATPANSTTIARGFIAQLRRASLVQATEGNGDERRDPLPAPPANRLLH